MSIRLHNSRAETATRLVRKSFEEITPSTPEELERVRNIPDSAIDFSDIPPANFANRVFRDSRGRLPVGRKSWLCKAILAELGRRRMTRYQLWKAARKRCSTLTESAVYEFLRGQREIGLRYLEALLRTLNLEVRPAAA